jgi:hypothetical protein
MANYYNIKCLPELNEVDDEKVKNLAASMLTNGWQGAPILYMDDMQLVTGSHRQAALKLLDENFDEYTEEEQGKIVDIFNSDIAVDVTDIINTWLEENEQDFNDIDFSSIGRIFIGTEIEKYKNEITEW